MRFNSYRKMKQINTCLPFWWVCYNQEKFRLNQTRTSPEVSMWRKRESLINCCFLFLHWTIKQWLLVHRTKKTDTVICYEVLFRTHFIYPSGKQISICWRLCVSLLKTEMYYLPRSNFKHEAVFNLRKFRIFRSLIFALLQPINLCERRKF